MDKILKSAEPGNLPIEHFTKLELVINLKTAKALGLTIPPSVLGRADEIVQQAVSVQVISCGSGSRVAPACGAGG